MRSALNALTPPDAGVIEGPVVVQRRPRAEAVARAEALTVQREPHTRAFLDRLIRPAQLMPVS